mmetsp:Transcript_29943/g.79811  ORF Transcript_29943/g.79811 Transcript_29943/m.79811 type:complete len:340 (-) Transcript_29943:774-1793(-)
MDLWCLGGCLLLKLGLSNVDFHVLRRLVSITLRLRCTLTICCLMVWLLLCRFGTRLHCLWRVCSLCGLRLRLCCLSRSFRSCRLLLNPSGLRLSNILCPPLLFRQLLLPLFDHLSPSILRLFRPPLLVGPLLFLLQHFLLHPGAKVLGRLAYHDLCNPLEVERAEAFQRIATFRLHEIGLHLHGDKVPALHWCDGVQRTLYALIIHLGNPKTHLWLVVATSPLKTVRPPDATLCGPLEDLPVAQLDNVRMVFEVLIHPIESALIRKHDGESHLLLSALWLNDLRNDGVLLRSIPKRAAAEREPFRQDLRAEVHVECEVAESDVGKQRFPLQPLWDLLGR